MLSLRKNGAIPSLPLLCLYGVDRDIFTSLFVCLFVWGLYNKKGTSHVLFTYFLVVLDITLLKLTVKDTAYNVICQKRNLNLIVIKYYSKKAHYYDR